MSSELQGVFYEYTQPTSLIFTSAGLHTAKVTTPFGHECECCIEYVNLTTADASLYIIYDHDVTAIPSQDTGVVGYLMSGVGVRTSLPHYDYMTKYATILANVGATNSAITVTLRFRRNKEILVPRDITAAFTTGE